MSSLPTLLPLPRLSFDPRSSVGWDGVSSTAAPAPLQGVSAMVAYASRLRAGPCVLPPSPRPLPLRLRRFARQLVLHIGAGEVRRGPSILRVLRYQGVARRGPRPLGFDPPPPGRPRKTSPDGERDRDNGGGRIWAPTRRRGHRLHSLHPGLSGSPRPRSRGGDDGGGGGNTARG